MVKKVEFEDDADLEMIAAYERGELKPAADSRDRVVAAEKSARRYFAKSSRINVRISEADVMRLKMRAAEEGMPYQTLIASILHKYVTGRLEDRR